MMQTRKADLMLLCAAVMCSIGGVCIRLCPWPPLAVNGARGLIAAAITAIYLAASGHKLRINFIVLQSAASLCLTMYLYVLCAKLTGAANAILLMYTSPIFVLAYMLAIKKQRPSTIDLYTIIPVILGIICFVLDGLRLGNIKGDLIGIASGAAYAGVFLVNTREGSDALSSYFIGQLAAGVIGLPCVLAQTDFAPVTLICVVLLGVVQLGLAYILMAKGLQSAEPLHASLITCIEPILSPLWVLLLCNEGMSVASLIGAAMVIGGIIFSAVQGERNKISAS